MGIWERDSFGSALTHFDIGSFKSCCLLVCLRLI